MRRYLILTFTLLLVVVIQVVPQVDLTDGDGGFSYAILCKPHFHPPCSAKTAGLPSALRLAAKGQPNESNWTPGAATATSVHCPESVSVLRC